eukprot:4670920-Ditylum_brightwellii.AAC.1
MNLECRSSLHSIISISNAAYDVFVTTSPAVSHNAASCAWQYRCCSKRPWWKNSQVANLHLDCWCGANLLLEDFILVIYC